MTILDGLPQTAWTCTLIHNAAFVQWLLMLWDTWLCKAFSVRTQGADI
jgi:hypothetical protein